MGFFKKIKKFALPVIGAIAGNAIAPGIGGAIGSGIGTKAAGGSIKDALLSAAGSYVGGQIGDSFGGAGNTVGTATGMSTLPWSGANTALGGSIADIIGAGAANSIAGAGLNGAIGSYVGSSLAQNAFGDAQGVSSSGASAPTLKPFSPTQEAEEAAPASLTGLGSLTSQQQSTNLANQGVYGGGNGPQEQSYFLNQINRRLVDSSGNVSQSADLAPIEQSYLQRLGIGGYGNTSNLLEAISKWRMNQAQAA